MASHFSVAIIGAGPSGASAAHSLLQSGVKDVALIDRDLFPRDKTCGDGLGAGVVDVVDRLDLNHIFDGQKLIKIISINFRDKIRVRIDLDQHDRPSPLGYVMTRTAFDGALVKTAIERGAEDLTGWGLERAERAGARWLLTLQKTSSGEQQTISCDVLIGADGPRSRVRRELGWTFDSPARTSIAIRGYVDVAPAEKGYQQFDFLADMPNPGYSWVFSDGGGRANIGTGCTVNARKNQNMHLKDLLARYCDTLGDQIRGEPEMVQTAILPIGFHRSTFADPQRNAILIGDAASMVNPAVGEGIFYGMYAGLILGRHLAPALQQSGNNGDALASASKEFVREFAASYRDARIMLKLTSHMKILEMLVRNFGASTDFCFDYIEFIMGAMPPNKSRSLPALLLAAVAPRLFARRS